LLISNFGSSVYVGSNMSTLTYLTVLNDAIINGHLTVQSGITWNGVLTATAMVISTSLSVTGACFMNGASTVNGQFFTHGIASFDASVTVGTTLTVGQALTVGTDVTVTGSIVAKQYCFFDSTCVTSWPNTSSIQQPAPDLVVFSQNVTLFPQSTKIVYVGTFTKEEIRHLYVELAQTDDANDDSYGVVDSSIVVSIKNKAAKVGQDNWNGGRIDNGAVWVRLYRYDEEDGPLNFICTVKQSTTS